MVEPSSGHILCLRMFHWHFLKSSEPGFKHIIYYVLFSPLAVVNKFLRFD